MRWHYRPTQWLRVTLEVLARRWSDWHCHPPGWGDNGQDCFGKQANIVLHSKRHTFRVAQLHHSWHLPKRNKAYVQSSLVCTCLKSARPVSITRGLWTCASILGRLCSRGRKEPLTTQHHGDVGVVTPSHV